jgi:tRNA pseudouridine38-40 synthase
MESMNRYKLIIEYDGTNFCGLQKQPKRSNNGKNSIETILQQAIFNLTKTEVKLFSSGRTDAGVHALGQVIHFDLAQLIAAHKIVAGLNFFLINHDIKILSCELVDQNFHARFSAKMRHYRYIIINRRAPLVIDQNRAWHVPIELNITEMQKGANFLIGKHDFSSFQDHQCQSKTAIRSINHISITKEGEKITIEISAKSFLHHMVRNIVGTLVKIGNNKIKATQIPKILTTKHRSASGPNAPACGLYFTKVEY